MKIQAKLWTQVEVDPKEVIQKLIENKIGYGGWVFIGNDGNFYKGSEVSAGTHSLEEKEPISKEEFEYVKALQLILKTLKESNK